MKQLEIDLACGDYDLVRPLRNGKVRAEGMDINFISIEKPPEVQWRMGIHNEFDAAEMSFGSYVAGKSRGDFPFVAIPAFVYRKFRHSAAYINTESGITRPEDLIGKRVGVPEWQMTATVWLRGILQDEHGVAVTGVEWFTGGLEMWGRKEKVPLQLPREINVKTIPEGETLSAMLVAGKIDALLSAQVPGPYVQRMPQIRRLYEHPRQAEADYFRRTGIFPIMHVMVIREELFRRHRWIAQSLFKALLQAKTICIDSAFKNDSIHSALPWAGNYLEEVRELMGEDFWPYGVEPNRKTIETFLRYAREQGLTAAPLKPEDLFARETIDTFRV